MCPVLAKVRYGGLGPGEPRRCLEPALLRQLALSLLGGRAGLMFALAWLLLPDQPAYCTGAIIVGLARCIAMVLIWNDLARGDRERAAVLVVFTALFQIVAYSLLGYFYLTVLPGWLGLDPQGFEVGIWEVARTVLIFLGIPLRRLSARRIGIRRRGARLVRAALHPALRPSRSMACCSRSCSCSPSRATRSPRSRRTWR